MPPSGYRHAAIKGLRDFLEDNLDYFIKIYGDQSSSQEAIAHELAEINRIKSNGDYPGSIKTVVSINEDFYLRLHTHLPFSWGMAETIGNAVIDEIVGEISKLTAT